ncbi:MAG TPA: YceI family protein [Candidatus Dormibacteraeota bacterium]
MSRRNLLVGVGAIALLVVLAAAAGGYAYFFSGLRTAPKPLALATPTPGASAVATPAAAGDLTGNWKVAAGSQAEWRVSEVFVGTTSPHQAVGRTSGVTGSLTVTDTGSGLGAGNLSFTADLTGLASVDQVDGRDVSERDHLVSQSLAVNRFPNATFQSTQTVALPAGFSDGQQVQLTVPGQLTIRGVTQDVTVNVTQLRLAGSQVQAAGMIQTTMGAFGVPPPRAPFVTLDQNVTIGFLLNFARA